MSHFYVLTDVPNHNKSFFKIGFTDNVGARIDQLQTGNPNRLFAVAVNKLDNPRVFEKLIHLAFRHKRVLNEWYELSRKDLMLIYDNMDNGARDCDCLGCDGYYSTLDRGVYSVARDNDRHETYEKKPDRVIV